MDTGHETDDGMEVIFPLYASELGTFAQASAKRSCKQFEKHLFRNVITLLCILSCYFITNFLQLTSPTATDNMKLFHQKHRHAFMFQILLVLTSLLYLSYLICYIFRWDFNINRCQVGSVDAGTETDEGMKVIYFTSFPLFASEYVIFPTCQNECT